MRRASASTGPSRRRTAALCGLACLLSAASPARAETFHVNCGGDDLLSHWGILFQADRPYAGGQWGWDGGVDLLDGTPVGGTEDPLLYETFHGSSYSFRYMFDVENGAYAVTLRFSDAKASWHGVDVMEVAAEGTVIHDALDVFARVGSYYAFDDAFLVDVADGRLDLEFTALAGMPRVCAISVIPEPVGYPVQWPGDLAAEPGIGEVILSWREPFRPAAGYVLSRSVDGGPFVPLADLDHLVERYIDGPATPGASYAYTVSVRWPDHTQSDPSGPAQAVPIASGATGRRDFFLEMEEEDLEALNLDPTTDEEFPAVFTAEGTAYPAEVRYRGSWGRVVAKKNWRADLGSALFEGKEVLNLNSGFSDPALVRESAGFHMAERTGTLGFASERVNLYLNGEFIGVHHVLEQADEHYLEARDLPESTAIYKCEGNLSLRPPDHYPLLYEKETGDPSDLSDLIEFIEIINRTFGQDFPEVISEVVDLYEYFSYYCVMVVTGNRDFSSHNYYLLREPGGKWKPILWDLDVSMGKSGTFSFGYGTHVPIDIGTRGSPDTWGYNVLLDRLLGFPQYRLMYAKMLERKLAGVFSADSLGGLAAGLFDEIEASARADARKWGWERMDIPQADLEDVLAWLGDRPQALLDDLEGFLPAGEDDGLRINEFQAANASTFPDEYGEFDDWIELFNSGADTVWLAGRYLGDDLHESRAWAFPDTFLAPGGFLLVWADEDADQGSLHAGFELNRNGEAVGLWDAAAEGNALLDWIEFGPQGNDLSMGRLPDGSGGWILFQDPTPGESNQGTAAVDPPSAAGALRLLSWPVPARTSQAIRFLAPPGRTPGPLEIFDASGRLVAQLRPRSAARGRSGFQWVPPAGTAAGLYFARLAGPERTPAAKIVLLP